MNLHILVPCIRFLHVESRRRLASRKACFNCVAEKAAEPDHRRVHIGRPAWCSSWQDDIEPGHLSGDEQYRSSPTATPHDINATATTGMIVDDIFRLRRADHQCRTRHFVQPNLRPYGFDNSTLMKVRRRRARPNNLVLSGHKTQDASER